MMFLEVNNFPTNYLAKEVGQNFILEFPYKQKKKIKYDL